MSEEEVTLKDIKPWQILLVGLIIGIVTGFIIADNSNQTCHADIQWFEQTLVDIYNVGNGTNGVGSSFVFREQNLGRLTELYFYYMGSGASRVMAQALFDNMCVQGKTPLNLTYLERGFGIDGNIHVLTNDTSMRQLDFIGDGKLTR